MLITAQLEYNLIAAKIIFPLSIIFPPGCSMEGLPGYPREKRNQGKLQRLGHQGVVLWFQPTAKPLSPEVSTPYALETGLLVRLAPTAANR